MHMTQLMPLPLTVSCFSKIQTGLPFWYRLTRVVPDKGPLNVCVCVCVCVRVRVRVCVCVTELVNSCVIALTDGNQHIRIRQKTLEFSSTVLSTVSPYLGPRSRVGSETSTCNLSFAKLAGAVPPLHLEQRREDVHEQAGAAPVHVGERHVADARLEDEAAAVALGEQAAATSHVRQSQVVHRPTKAAVADGR